MEKIEFRLSPDGNLFYKCGDNAECRLTKFCTDIIEVIDNRVKSDYPECYARLASIYGGKGKEHHAVLYNIVCRFIRCNFGEHDLLTHDIDGEDFNFEEVRCPIRGMCEHEGIICKPKAMSRLGKAERDVARLYIEGYTFDKIAEILGKSPSTVKVQLCRIKDRLGLSSCREIIRVLRNKIF